LKTTEKMEDNIFKAAIEKRVIRSMANNVSFKNIELKPLHYPQSNNPGVRNVEIKNNHNQEF
jgi:hypothetical protein